MRLDTKIANDFEIAREKAKEIIEAGEVLLNGKPILKPSYKVNDEVIEVNQGALEQLKTKLSSLKPSDIPLEIIFEDDFLLVINKQAGVSTHPASSEGEDTIANAIAKFVLDFKGIRPGIVHRLDKDTTGLMIIAKTEEAKTKLSDMMAKREVERRYVALCYGSFKLPNFQIKTNIIRDLHNRQKMRICKNGGKEAITNVFVKESFFSNNFSLIELKLETGRTHQIRLHLSHNENPIIGDGMYGFKPPSFFEKFAPNEELYQKLTQTKRQMLHAFSLKFQHPFTGEEIALEVNPPEDFQSLLSILKTGASK
jgi:23S rRNA pseudouridine1911/1915/1917 synthase